MRFQEEVPNLNSVKSIKVEYVPIHERDGLHTEIKILSLGALKAACVEVPYEPVDSRLIVEALRVIKLSLRSVVSWVYVIKSTNHPEIKIGVSSDPDVRVKQLSTGSFDEITLLAKISGTPRLEKALHAVFVKQRINGEWFAYDSTMQEFVKQLQRLESESRTEGNHSELSRGVEGHSSTAETLIGKMRSLISKA